jgi:hypothetical protein
MQEGKVYAVTPMGGPARASEVLQGITVEVSAPVGGRSLPIERAPLRLSGIEGEWSAAPFVLGRLELHVPRGDAADEHVAVPLDVDQSRTGLGM